MNTDSSAGTSKNYHALPGDAVIADLNSSQHGLRKAEVKAGLIKYEPNTFRTAKPPGIGMVFVHQFASPLIYVLVATAILSLAIQEYSDAGFITAVLLLLPSSVLSRNFLHSML